MSVPIQYNQLMFIMLQNIQHLVGVVQTQKCLWPLVKVSPSLCREGHVLGEASFAALYFHLKEVQEAQRYV